MILYLLFLSLPANSEKCRALSLEGGGSHGAYEAGCMSELAALLPVDDIKWNIVTGISTGALNSGVVAQYAMGEEKAMSDFAVYIWTHLNGSSAIYQEWPGGVVQGIVFKSGLYDTTPMKETLHKFFLRGINRNVTVGATNLNTGFFANFNESLGDEMLEAVVCSASPPLFFPPQDFQNSIWADGGCIINLDVFTAVERCLDVVGKQEDVIVDMLYDDHMELQVPKASFNTLQVMSRAKQIRNYDTYTYYTYNALIAYPNVNFRYTIKPSKPLPGGYLPLDFNQSDLEGEIELGRSDTREVVSSAKTGRERILERYEESRSRIFYISE